MAFSQKLPAMLRDAFWIIVLASVSLTAIGLVSGATTLTPVTADGGE